jgi:hypothetical protein
MALETKGWRQSDPGRLCGERAAARLRRTCADRGAGRQGRRTIRSQYRKDHCRGRVEVTSHPPPERGQDVTYFLRRPRRHPGPGCRLTDLPSEVLILFRPLSSLFMWGRRPTGHLSPQMRVWWQILSRPSAQLPCGATSLAGWLTSFHHVVGEAQSHDLKPELEQFAVDARHAPSECEFRPGSRRSE